MISWHSSGRISETLTVFLRIKLQLPFLYGLKQFSPLHPLKNFDLTYEQTSSPINTCDAISEATSVAKPTISRGSLSPDMAFPSIFSLEQTRVKFSDGVKKGACCHGDALVFRPDVSSDVLLADHARRHRNQAQ
jgi:hypothetical protein